MDFTDFSGVFQYLILHGYAIMFVGMLIDGPSITAVSAFAASLGYFSLSAVFALSLLGELVADALYYSIGYFGRLKVIDRFVRKAGFSDERIKKFERLLHEHSVKTIIALKLAPFVSAPCLMLVGAAKLDIKRFVSAALLVTVPRSLLFLALGYYFGQSFSLLQSYINGFGLLVVFILLITVVYYLYKIISEKISQNVEKI